MIELYRRILIKDADGFTRKDTGPILCDSFVIQFLELLRGWFKSADKTATDVDNAEFMIMDVSLFAQTQGGLEAGAGTDTYGIVVGTNAGVTAEGNEDYALDTKILHDGAGAAGKLNYQAMTFVAPGVVGPNVDMDISRAFLNETGNPITVKEIGIICVNKGIWKFFLLLRDVVADEVVADAETLTVVYTLRTTA